MTHGPLLGWRGAARGLMLLMLAAVIAACSSAPKRSGGYYLDDGPGGGALADPTAVPDALPQLELLNRGTMQPYTVMGQSYTPMTALAPYRVRGVASWYGRRYHGKPTASGEPYNMYAMTAAHTILPIPSYARVTNLSNDKSVVVRINDRGPFINDRVIDLSYSAAAKLGLLTAGSGMVEVVSLNPGLEAPAPAPTPSAVTTSASVSGPIIAETAPTAYAVLPPTHVAAVAPTAPTTAALVPADAPRPALASAPAASAAAGSYVQFGAFGIRANAEIYLQRLRAQFDWLSAQLRISHSGGLYRVQAGPFSSEAAARASATRAGQTLGVSPIVISR